MSWSFFNALTSGAKPVWLYRFVIGAQTFYYTSSGAAITTEAGVPDATFLTEQEWVPRSVSTGSLKRAQATSKTTVTVTLPKNDAATDAILLAIGIVTMEVTVWQGFLGDPDNELVKVFIGSPQQVKPSYTKVQLLCQDLSATLNNKAIARVIQAPCPYEIFGRGCGLAEGPWTVAANVTGMSGAVLTITEAAGYTDGYFGRGRLKYGDHQQTIGLHVGNQITLVGAIAGLEEAFETSGSVAVEILPGCKKSLAYCDTFGNTDNYGGLPELLTSPYTGEGIL